MLWQGCPGIDALRPSCTTHNLAGFGLAIGNAAAHQLVISASDPNTKVLKNGLKVAGASWLVYAAHNAYLANVRRAHVRSNCCRALLALGTAVCRQAIGSALLSCSAC